MADSKAPGDLWRLFTDPPSLLTPGEAESFLTHLAWTVDLQQLFQHYFPQEFQVAQEQQMSFIPEDRYAHSQYEAQFFRLVNEHLFPLPLFDMPYDEPWYERDAYSIPVEPFGFEFEADEAYGELPLGWQLLLYLLGVLSEDDIRAYGNYEDDDLFAIPLPEQGRDISWGLLTLRCQAQGGPIAYLPLAVEMLENDTGSVWLDANFENPCTDACWTVEDVDELHKQYLWAQDIRAKAESFCDWLEERPVPHFTAVVRLWNSCLRDTPRRPPRPQMMTVTGAQFVEGINFNELFGRQIALPPYRGGEP